MNNTPPTSDLAPCPFCGGFSEHDTNGGRHFRFCWTCQATGPYCETAAEATAAWNRRAATSVSGALHEGEPITPEMVEQAAQATFKTGPSPGYLYRFAGALNALLSGRPEVGT